MAYYETSDILLTIMRIIMIMTAVLLSVSPLLVNADVSDRSTHAAGTTAPRRR